MSNRMLFEYKILVNRSKGHVTNPAMDALLLPLNHTRAFSATPGKDVNNFCDTMIMPIGFRRLTHSGEKRWLLTLH